MPAKLTPEHYRQLAASRGYVWLGTEVINNRTKTLWRCELGHEWLMPYDNLQQGQSCPTCSREHQYEMRRRKPEDYHALAEQRGFKWVGLIAKNSKTPTEWECSFGHRWLTSFESIREGCGCPICTRQHQNDGRRKLPDDFRQLADKSGFVWIGEYPGNVHQPTLWRCLQGHEWLASYDDVRSGHGCPYCANRAPKSTAEYHGLAQSHNLRWVGDSLPSNVREKTKWQCEKGHVSVAAYIEVYGRLGCPYCAKNSRKTAGDYADLAKSRGFFWLGPMPQSTNHKTSWQCPQGHVWDAEFSNVYHRESGCPFCVDMVNGRRVSQPQRDLHQMLGGELNYRVAKYAIDIALTISGIKIAVEYDCWYWHQGKEAHAQKREHFLVKNGWRIVYIKAGMLLPTQEQVDAAIDHLLSGSTTTNIILADWRD